MFVSPSLGQGAQLPHSLAAAHADHAVCADRLAGLSAAYLLSTIANDSADGVTFDVHVYEKAASTGLAGECIELRLPACDRSEGGDSSSTSSGETRRTFALDTPMRAIHAGTHDRTTKLYAHIGAKLAPATFSYSFATISATFQRFRASPQETAGSQRWREGALTGSSLPPPYEDECAPPYSSSGEPVPDQRAQILYEGQNGLRWPPLRLPSHAAHSPLKAAAHLWALLWLSLAYLHVLALAFFYHSLGLTQDHGNRPRTRLLGLVKAVANEPLGQWCQRHGVATSLSHDTLIPLFAALATVSRSEAAAMPAGDVLNYIIDTFRADHCVARDGVKDVAERLLASVPRESLHFSDEIKRVERTPRETYKVFSAQATEQGREFDHVILATQANHARTILEAYKPAKSDEAKHRARLAALGQFEYVHSVVVNHTDASILPPNARDHRDLNLASFDVPKLAPSPSSTDALQLGAGHTMATHIISRTRPELGDSLVMQTTNPIVPIDSTHVLSVAHFERVKVTSRSKVARGLFFHCTAGTLQGGTDGDGLHFVGSWCHSGIPLLEGCVASAEAAARAIARAEGIAVELPY